MVEKKSIFYSKYDINYKNYKLYRIADIRDNNIHQFVLNKKFDESGENRGNFYGIRDVKENQVYIGEWCYNFSNEKNKGGYSNEDRYRKFYEVNDIKEAVNEGIIITEILFVDFKCVDQIISNLKEKNIKGYNRNNDLLILNSELLPLEYYEGIYLENYSYEIKNGSIEIKDDIYVIEEVLIDKYKVIYNSVFDITLYSQTEKPKINREIYFKSSEEVLNEFFSGNNSKSRFEQVCKDLDIKNTRQIKKIFNKIVDYNSDEIIKEITTKTNCKNDSKARKMVRSFVKKKIEFLDNEDILSILLKKVVNTDEKIKKSFYSDFERKWKEENKKKITENNKEIESREKYLNDIINKINKKNDELLKIENIIEKKHKIETDLDYSVNNKIDKAKNDISDFFADYLIYSHADSANDKNISKYNLEINSLEGKYSFIENKELDSFTAIIDNFSLFINDDDICQSLSFYLLSLFFNNRSVIFAGPKSFLLAKIFSLSIVGKVPYIVDCHRIDENFNIIEECSNHEIVIIKNLFDYKYMNSIIMDIDSMDKFFIILTPFIEELLIEPKSIHNYFSVLWTEFIPFKTNNKKELYKIKDLDEFKETIARGIHEIYDLKSKNMMNNNLLSINNEIWRDFITFYLIYNNYKYVPDVINEIDDNEYLLILIPYIVSIYGINDFYDIINEKYSDDDVIKIKNIMEKNYV